MAMSQSTSSCSDSETSSPVTIWLMPSMLPVVENAQQEPHYTSTEMTLASSASQTTIVAARSGCTECYTCAATVNNRAHVQSAGAQAGQDTQAAPAAYTYS